MMASLATAQLLRPLGPPLHAPLARVSVSDSPRCPPQRPLALRPRQGVVPVAPPSRRLGWRISSRQPALPPQQFFLALHTRIRTYLWTLPDQHRVVHGLIGPPWHRLPSSAPRPAPTSAMVASCSHRHGHACRFATVCPIFYDGRFSLSTSSYPSTFYASLSRQIETDLFMPCFAQTALHDLSAGKPVPQAPRPC